MLSELGTIAIAALQLYEITSDGTLYHLIKRQLAGRVSRVRTPDHPPEKALKRRSFKALLYVSIFSLYSNDAVQQFAGVFIRWFVDHIFCFPFLHYDAILHYHDPVADHAYKGKIM